MTTQFSVFGSEHLYPGLFTPDQPEFQRGYIAPKFWSFAIDLCRLSKKLVSDANKVLYIGAVSQRDITLVNGFGAPALLLTKMSSTEPTEYRIRSFCIDLKERGRHCRNLQSKNLKYLTKRIGEKGDERTLMSHVIHETDTNMVADIAMACNHFVAKLNSETNGAGTIPNIAVPPDAVYAATRALFDPNYSMAQIPPSALTKLQTVYESVKNMYDKKKSYMDRIADFFNHEKWVIGYQPYANGDPRLLIGTGEFKIANAIHEQYSFTMTKQLRAYRDLEHFYETNPNEVESLKSALLICKVYRERDPANNKTHCDKDGLIPGQDLVLEDISGVSHCRSYTATENSAFWTLLSK